MAQWFRIAESRAFARLSAFLLTAAATVTATAGFFAVRPERPSEVCGEGDGCRIAGDIFTAAFPVGAAAPADTASFPAVVSPAGDGEAISSAAAKTAEQGSGLFPDYILRGKLRHDTENHPRGTVVRVLEGQSDCYYLVQSDEGDRMVVAWEALTLLPPPSLSLPEVGTAEIEREAARRGFTSATDCLLWTCLYRLETYLLCRRDGGWQLCGRMACSAGDTAHPTPTGRFAVATKLTSVGKPDRYLCRHAMCFHGAYMYHSVLLSPAGDCVLDGRLGCRISHGCIRLAEEQAAALFAAVPCGTAVYIN